MYAISGASKSDVKLVVDMSDTISYWVLMFHSCRSPPLLATIILFRYVAGCSMCVAVKPSSNWIWWSNSVAGKVREETSTLPTLIDYLLGLYPRRAAVDHPR